MAFVNVEAATFLVGEEGFDAKTPSVVPGGEARIGQIGDEVYSLRLKADVIERLEFRIEQSLQGFPVRCVRLL